MFVDIEDGFIGAGWPDPKQPGVPADPQSMGAHWMAWPRTGVLTIGRWWPGNDECEGAWVISYRDAGFTKPADMAHLNYLGRILPEPLFTKIRGKE